MKVFVWKSCGEISVHSAEGYSQILSLKTRIVELLNAEGSEVSVGSSWGKIIGEIEAQVCSRSDLFESGTGFYNVEE